ncbi:MAG: thioredoxin domain-containing protein [Saprospiraceae bacterium]
MMAPSVENVSREFQGRVLIGKLDVDANTTTTLIHEVRSIPTLVFYKDGAIVHRSSGYVTEESLREIITRLL